MNNNYQHPIQPICKDEYDTPRFKKNKIVRFLLDAGPFDMNKLAMMDFSQEDRIQFAQLIGYSLDGFSELSYVNDEVYGAAVKMYHDGQNELEARNNELREQLKGIREGLRKAVSHAFKNHPDDLEV